MNSDSDDVHYINNPNAEKKAVCKQLKRLIDVVFFMSSEDDKKYLVEAEEFVRKQSDIDEDEWKSAVDNIIIKAIQKITDTYVKKGWLKLENTSRKRKQNSEKDEGIVPKVLTIATFDKYIKEFKHEIKMFMKPEA